MMKPMKFDTKSPRTSSKESYLLPQPEGVLRVQDYLFAEIGGTRCVLLRWVMEADYPVDSFTFVLTELDASEKPLHTRTLTCGRADVATVAKGAAFVPTDAIPVQEHCTAVQVQLTEVRSGNYAYCITGTRVEVVYRAPEPWAYDKKPGREDRLSDKHPLRVIRKRAVRPRFLWPAAVLTAILMILMLLDPYIPRPPEDQNHEKETIVGGGSGLPFDSYETGVFYVPSDGQGDYEVQTFVYGDGNLGYTIITPADKNNP
jgi:hypothetical protein